MKEQLSYKRIPLLRKEILKEGVENLSNSDPSKERDLPIAPIVTAHYVKDSAVVFFRIVVFVDKENKIEPYFEVSEDELSFRVVFDSSVAKPTIFTAWYFEAEFNRTTNTSVNYIVYNYNLDPRTSRGTITVVSSDVPSS